MANLLIFDPTSENAANAPLNITDTATPYALVAHEYPAPPLALSMVGSVEGDGDGVADSRYENRRISLTLDVVGTTAALLRDALGDLEQMILKLSREGGTLQRVMPSGETITFDVLAVESYQPTFDLTYELGYVARVSVGLLALPYGRGAEVTLGYIFDDFSVDSIADYTFDAGSGTLAVSGGQLVPSDTAEKVVYHSARGYTYTDAQGTVKIIVPATVGTGAVGVVLRRLDATNHIRGDVDVAGALRIYKRDAGADTQLAAVAATVSASTAYWLRFRAEGSVLTLDWFTSEPTPTSTPATTLTHTLTGGDLTKFGAGIAGQAGLRTGTVATTYRYDDFTVEPHFTTTSPVLTFNVPPVPGDAHALGKLLVNEGQGADQRWVTWGIQSRNYSSASTAALFYQAESLTPLGGAATAVGPSGASGSGSNVVRHTSLPAAGYTVILSTQATGGGAHLSHVGTFRVYVRVQVPTGNTGAVSVCMEWGEGDLRVFTRNPVSVIPADVWDGTWRLVDLGLVSLSKVTQGTQRWEGRVLAKAAVAGEDLDVDCLFLVPVDEGSGVVGTTATNVAPTSFQARDEFDQANGNLTGTTLPEGGTWGGAGDADHITVGPDVGNAAARIATSDASATSTTGPRYAIAGSTNYTATVVQVDITVSDTTITGLAAGPMARYTDTSNHLRAYLTADDDGYATVEVRKMVAGTSTVLGSTRISPIAAVAWYTLRLQVSTDGGWIVWWASQGTPLGSAILEGQDAVLATGGALATGKPGFVDGYSSAAALTRRYDNFIAWTPVTDAAIFGSQSLEIRHDRVTREDSAGAIWTPVSRYRGDHLLLPPAGRESRTTRVIVKASRNDPATGPDSAIDDISARLYAVPRFLSVPS